MPVRLSGLLAAALLPLVVAPASAAEPPSELEISSEVRILKVPAGFCERVGIARDACPTLTEREMRLLLEAAQGHRETVVMQFPKVTTLDGRSATVRVGDQKKFATGLEAGIVEGKIGFTPTTKTIELGDTLTLCGTVSADQKFVNLRAKLTRTTEIGHDGGYPLMAMVSLIPEGGGATPPTAQTLRLPMTKTVAVEKTAVVPTGGTVVLGVWKESGAVTEFGPLVLSKVPYVNRLFKNPSVMECEVIVLATTRVMRCDEAKGSTGKCESRLHPADAVPPVPVAPPAPVDPACRAEVHKLRHVAAADAAAAVKKQLDGNAQEMVVVAEPVANTVLVSGEPAVAKKVAAMLAELDVAPPQTLIQALVMEVPQGWLADIGLKQNAGKPLVLTERELAMFQAAIRKEKEKGGIDILSRPQMQVANNQTGLLQVGGQVLVPSGLELVSSSQGGFIVARKLTHLPRGVSLAVTPQAEGSDGGMVLRVETQVSSVVENAVKVPLTLPPEITGLKEPVTYQVGAIGAVNSQAMRVAVRMQSGQTMILSAGVRKQKQVILTAGGERKEEGEIARETLVILTAYRVAPDPVRPATHAQPAPPPPMPAPYFVPATVSPPAVTPAPAAPTPAPIPGPLPNGGIQPVTPAANPLPPPTSAPRVNPPYWGSFNGGGVMWRW